MSYVPIVVPPAETPPSPRARELADQLARVMVDFEHENPTVTKAEMRQATQLALRATKGTDALAAPVIFAVLGVLVLAGLLAAYVATSGTVGAAAYPLIGGVFLATLVGLLVFVLRRSP